MELKKSLKKLLKRYELIKDIILFGSYTKGRSNPKDIDLAFIVKEKDIGLVGAIKDKLNAPYFHLEFIVVDDIYLSPLFLSLLNEGYSIKKGDILRNALNIRPMRIYTYNLKHLGKSRKTLFGIALKKNLKKVHGEKIGAGAVLIPISQTSYFEDFLDVWEMKYSTKEWTVI